MVFGLSEINQEDKYNSWIFNAGTKMYLHTFRTAPWFW